MIDHGHSQLPTAASVSMAAGHPWRKLPVIFFVVGILSLGYSLFAGFATKDEQFYFSYLVAFVYWVTASLGALFFVLVQHATRSGWSTVVRRIAETLTIPLWTLLPVGVIPLLCGMHTLYHWTHADAVAHDAVLQHKQAYLNEHAFTVRAIAYVVIWAIMALLFLRQSLAQDRTGNAAITRRLQAASAPGIMVFAATITFAAFDWVLSLDPHWYSTMFGVYFFAGILVANLSILSLIVVQIMQSGLVGDCITKEHQHDLGKLLFAYSVFWTYIGFSQFMLIWYANLPEETIWYAHRGGGWLNTSIFLALGHFVVPFFFLMSRHVKRNRLGLSIGALWMAFMHFVDLHWLIMPIHHVESLHLTLLDLTTMLGLGGLWLGVVSFAWTRVPLVPVKDPRLSESLAFENF